MKDKLKQQFKKLHDDCMYTADAHYITATDSNRLFLQQLLQQLLLMLLVQKKNMKYITKRVVNTLDLKSYAIRQLS